MSFSADKFLISHPSFSSSLSSLHANDSEGFLPTHTNRHHTLHTHTHGPAIPEEESEEEGGDLDLRDSDSDSGVNMSLELEVKSTPIPALQMLMICLVTFVEPVQFGMLFPFVYFMIRDFHVAANEQDLGFWVGVLASSFCVAQLITSLPWGYISDRIGRRPVILIGLLGNAITCTLFGFSKTFAYALTMRSLNGFLNGNVGVVKSMLGEMTDATNRGRAFSYWESAYGLGTIVGPMLGGILVDPVSNYPWLFSPDSIFKTYPYLLPCLVSSVVSVAGSAIGYVYMEESAPGLSKYSSNATLEEEEPLLDSTPIHSEKPSVMETLTPKVMASILLYASWCLVTIIYEEVYALYIAEPISKGGLAFTSMEIGTILSLSGLIQVVSQLVIFPIFEKWLGLVGTFRLASLLLALFSFLLPFTTDYAIAVGAGEGYTPGKKQAVSILLFFMLAGKTLATVIGYIPVIIFVNDSAPSPASLGTVHGCGQVFASLVRSIGPTLGGFMWSWSLLPSHQIPFDFHFTWFVVAVLCLGCFAFSYRVERILRLNSGAVFLH